MEKGDKINENPFVLAASTDQRAAVYGNHVLFHFTPSIYRASRSLAAGTRHNKREKRQNCLLWVQFKTQSKQGRVSREKISVSFKKASVVPTLQGAIFPLRFQLSFPIYGLSTGV